MSLALINKEIPFEFVNEPVPLRIDESGTVRVGNTRVILDLVIGAFHQGRTPEKIVEMFTTLRLADVYAVIGYYLQHRVTVDAYLRQRQEAAEEFRRFYEAQYPSNGLRERLLARRTAKEALSDVKHCLLMKISTRPS